MYSKTTLGNNFPCVSCQGLCTLIYHESLSLPPPCTYVQEGENTVGIAHLRACQGRSYFGQIQLTPKISVQVVQCNGLHSELDPR